MKIFTRQPVIAVILATIAGCTDTAGPEPPPTVDEILTNEAIMPDPSGFAPLTARIDLETEIPVSIRLRIVGKGGAAPDVTHEFAESGTSLQIPVLGLYADYQNTVELTFVDELGRELGTRSFDIQTPPLSPHLPSITIDQRTASMADGVTLVSYLGHGGDSAPDRPFIFDRDGEIRWYLDFAESAELAELSYNDGVERLNNGNLYFADEETDRIFEVDMFGRILNTWDMPGYGFHHQLLEKPNGNFLLSVNKDGIDTVEDHIIEIDRSTGAIINEWDLRESLDYDRTTWSDDRTDWVHVNAVDYDERDNTIIVSGRVQGVIKLTENNDVVWILAPHRGWGTAGDGTDLNQFLLQPLDADGQPITDPAVLDGDVNHPDFEWNWYQHAPLLTPDGTLMLFDNGDNRNYTGDERYSRVAEFEIDEEAMTVRKVWSYGKNRGPDTYSRIVSDVDYLPESNHVFFSPGAIGFRTDPSGKIVELDYASREVLFEATITPPPQTAVTFHRTERLPLYPGS